MYTVVLASALVVGAPGLKGPPPPEPPPDGEWVAERVEEGGRDIPGLHGLLVRIGGDTLVTRVAGRRFYEIPVAFNTAAKVKEFDLTEADRKGPQRGIYMVDGDSLTMCVCTTPSGPRPTAFKADAPDRRLLVLKRVKKTD
jgi:uncharacterized protein (TIGR03067 family)